MSTLPAGRRVVVGYSATKAGRDALAFAARLARATGAVLDVTVILPGGGRSVITPHDPSYTEYLREQAQRWIAKAIDRVPGDVTAHAHVRQADSFAEGLIEVADALDARCIVVGAADGASRGQHRLGATTSELLHSSDVPVVLVPRGARKIPASAGISRVTVGIGVRPGADALLTDTRSLADATGAPIRLLSLLPVDVPVGADTGTIRLAATTEIAEVLAAARATLPDDLDAEVVTAEGETIDDALARLDWQAGEVLLVGSSRLAQPKRLFLGSTAAKMLRRVPVPVIVVPRTRTIGGVR
ncbi:universal stress protein [Microbacterium telephonicum]|uniref:Universal stress protein family protein n=1 Tax=Microbacterium telephonicum TaxID=1714841 RepID=A0A498CMC0_9MICO|nr:universal stress protein [Microbacterium telephonicum]RLK52878.1 universal stress protein family protein [Microbacterium telephonicum]